LVCGIAIAPPSPGGPEELGALTGVGATGFVVVDSRRFTEVVEGWEGAGGGIGPLLVDIVEAGGLEAVFCPELIACARFVDRLTMSFPWTTRLSLDFFKSLVSISASFTLSANRHVSRGLGEVPSPPMSKSITSPTRTLITPKNP
jgi:hypothetical protein